MSANKSQLTAYILSYLAFGYIGLKFEGPWKRWSTGRAVDIWTLTHVFWGWLGARMNQSFAQQMTLAGINEIFEFFLRRYRPDIVWGEGEPGLNVPVDLLSNAIGWRLGSQK